MASKNVKKQKLQEQKEIPKKQRSNFGFFNGLLKIFVIFTIAVLSIGLITRATSPEFQHYGIVYRQLYDRITNTTATGFVWIDNKLNENIPEHYKLVKDTLQPYWILVKDFTQVVINFSMDLAQNGCDYVKIKYPVVIASIDNYAPGLLDNTKKICNNVYNETIRYYHFCIDYFQKEVFTGKLSPDNFRKIIIEAYLTTSAKAAEYYHWAYNKVYYTVK